MTTEVILLKPVDGLGAEGDKVAVKNGYARNYLLPQRIATLATLANVRQLDELKRRRTEREAAELAGLREIADKIAKLTLSIPVQTGQGGKLFGAVTTHHITEALAKENITVEHRRVELKHPIHALGTFDVEIKLHPEVTAKLKFSVVSSNAPGTEEAAGAEARPRGRRPRAEGGEARKAAKPEKAEKAAPAEKAERPEKGEKKQKK
ncbi:MAG: 50S ribosomal protein L9 [Verrucomicrobia bacterium]|nr:50S ribosomal protein L9 [Verrucomicrobiota bacterium]